MSFVEACKYMTNYTAGHETRTRLLRPDHMNYPDNHIEADNRLTWFLGELDEIYGDDAFYVYLKRDIEEVARSYARRRFVGGILRAYYDSIKMGASVKPFEELTFEECKMYARDYAVTAMKNIDFFLKDKSNVLCVELSSIREDFAEFWEIIGAEGDKESALRSFETKYNASEEVWIAPRKLTQAVC